MPNATAVNPAQTPALPTPTSSLADAALSYAAMGWSVFPLVPRTKIPFKGSHGYKDATTDIAVVEQWWREHPDANIGLATSNLTVLDVDPRHGGHLSLADLETQHGPLPYTVESQTGSGGRHLFFLRPDVSIRAGTNALAPGLDIKSGGPHVVLPPSIHPNGQAYEWELSSVPGEVDVAPMPEWMVEALTTPTVQTTPHTKSSTTLGLAWWR
jgi:Bifunctional DNA primase/polymerase, N-terminal